MSLNTQIDDRLAFLEVDSDTRTALKDFLPLIEKSLPGIIKEFYTHLASYPQLIGMFGTGERREKTINHAATAQTRHWLNLFSGRFDASYVESVRIIGLTHSRIGLDPRWYIGGYAFTLNRVWRLVSFTYHSRLNPQAAQEKTAQMMRAVNQAVMLDMDLAISIYIEENKRTYDEKLERLAGDFEASIKSVVDTVTDSATGLQHSANALAKIVDETKIQTGSVVSATEQAATNVQAIASATEELSASSGEIAQQIEQSSQIARQAVETATHSTRTVTGLSEAVQKIGDIVQMIQQIAEQTNLLALNATIEAARAGDAGKGFAVVASEVKALANQTAKATEDISRQIADVQAATNQTVSEINTIGETIRNISNASTAIASAVQEQTAATGEISRNIQQTATGTNEISGNISKVAQSTLQTENTSQQVLSASTSLSQQADTLRSKVETFLAVLRGKG